MTSNAIIYIVPCWTLMSTHVSAVRPVLASLPPPQCPTRHYADGNCALLSGLSFILCMLSPLSHGWPEGPAGAPAWASRRSAEWQHHPLGPDAGQRAAQGPALLWPAPTNRDEQGWTPPDWSMSAWLLLKMQAWRLEAAAESEHVEVREHQCEQMQSLSCGVCCHHAVHTCPNPRLGRLVLSTMQLVLGMFN